MSNTVVVVGGCAVDESYRATAPHISSNHMLETSTPCHFLFRAPGGVGRNIADVLTKLLPVETNAFRVELLSAVSKLDLEGRFLLQACKSAKIGTRHIARLATATTSAHENTARTTIAPIVPSLHDAAAHDNSMASAAQATWDSGETEENDQKSKSTKKKPFHSMYRRSSSSADGMDGPPAATAKYVAILDGKGELAAAAAAMSIFESDEFLQHIHSRADLIRTASAVVIDCNLPAAHFRLAITLAKLPPTGRNAPPLPKIKVIAIDPISIEKGRRCVPALLLQHRHLALLAAAQQGLYGGGTEKKSKEYAHNNLSIMKPNHIEAAAMVEEVFARLLERSSLLLSERHHLHLPRILNEELDAKMPKDCPFIAPVSHSSDNKTGFSNLAHAVASNASGQHHHQQTFTSSSQPAAGDFCESTLRQAARNAIILLLTLELDVVVVSCGRHGALVCFKSPKALQKLRDDNEEDTSDTNKYWFFTNWRQISIDKSVSKLFFTPPPGFEAQQIEAADEDEDQMYCLRWFPPIRVARVLKVTGAGDTFLSSLVSYLLVKLLMLQKQKQKGSLEPLTHFWQQHVPRYEKAALLTEAVRMATGNAALALQTASGATPALEKMSTAITSKL